MKHDYSPGSEQMKRNSLLDVQSLGQSIWIDDDVHCGATFSGQLQQWIEEGISGVTSNLSVLERALTEGGDYGESIQNLILKGMSSKEIFRALAVENAQSMADLLLPAYHRTAGRDGFVSLEVSPNLVHDTAATIAEARQLWLLVDRPNVMIKVPATPAGLPAIRRLIGEGINVNITLLFGLRRYLSAADAYLGGLEMLAAQGKPLQETASVASVSVSPIDTLIDPILEEKMKGDNPRAGIAARSHGQIAVASARVIYEVYREIFSSDRFLRLADQGARIQKLLWIDTSVKNPAYKDTRYMEALIAPDTISAAPIEALLAFRDRGQVEQTLDQDVYKAYHLINRLPLVDIDLNAIMQQLEDHGVEKSIKTYNQLVNLLKEKSELHMSGASIQSSG